MTKIKEKRKELKLSQEEVARQSKLSLQQYYLLEIGKQQNPTKETMESIAKTLKTTVTDLFFPNEKEKVA